MSGEHGSGPEGESFEGAFDGIERYLPPEHLELLEGEREARLALSVKLAEQVRGWWAHAERPPDLEDVPGVVSVRTVQLEARVRGSESGEQLHGIVSLFRLDGVPGHSHVTLSFAEVTDDAGPLPPYISFAYSGADVMPQDADLVTLAKIVAITHPDAAEVVGAERWEGVRRRCVNWIEPERYRPGPMRRLFNVLRPPWRV